MKKNIGSFSLMKRMNTAAILKLIREKGAVSRVDISKETGLTAATVTNLTSELIENKLVVEFTTGVSTGGRKPILLKINSDEFCVASASVSPDRVEFAVSDFCAKIIYYRHLSINENATAQECVDFIVKSLGEFQQSTTCRIIGLGIGIHGIVDSTEGISVYAPNLNWRNINFKKLISAHTDIPVFVDNDVRLAALAEMWFGISKSYDNFVLLYVGRGVGSSIVINKQLIRGSNDSAGEIGHSVIDIDGPLCQCGKRGCLQAFTNEEAMLSDLRKNLDKTSVLTENSSCDDIIDAYLNCSDEAAKIVIENEIKYLAIGISNIINIFNPSLVVLSSDVKNFDIALGNKLPSEVAKYAVAGGDNSCNIAYSTLGTRALLQGASALVLSHVYENPGILWDNKDKLSGV